MLSQVARIAARRIAVTPSLSVAPARMAHVSVPEENGAYKRSSSGVSGEADYSRRAFTYSLVAAGGVVGLHTAKVMVNDFLDTMSTSADVKAMAQLEVDLSAIPEGNNVVLKWQGKPLFVRHRTDAEVSEVRSVETTSLVDPCSDQDRTKQEKWLIVLGICTHLGCVPISHAGDFNGYFCPCHGSHYDASGRIRKGPAPLNLEVPPYKFTSDSDVLVG